MRERSTPYPFSQQALDVLELAWNKSGQLGSESVGAEHFLWSALHSGADLGSALARLDSNAVATFEAALIPRLVPGESPVSSGHLPYSGEMRAALKEARTLADSMRHGRIRVAHVLLALTDAPERLTVDIVARSGVGREDFRMALLDVLSDDPEP